MLIFPKVHAHNIVLIQYMYFVREKTTNIQLEMIKNDHKNDFKKHAIYNNDKRTPSLPHQYCFDDQ